MYIKSSSKKPSENTCISSLAAKKPSENTYTISSLAAEKTLRIYIYIYISSLAAKKPPEYTCLSSHCSIRNNTCIMIALPNQYGILTFLKSE